MPAVTVKLKRAPLKSSYLHYGSTHAELPSSFFGSGGKMPGKMKSHGCKYALPPCTRISRRPRICREHTFSAKMRMTFAASISSIPKPPAQKRKSSPYPWTPWAAPLKKRPNPWTQHRTRTPQPQPFRLFHRAAFFMGSEAVRNFALLTTHMRAQVRGTAVGFLLTMRVLEQAILYARRE